MAKRKYDYKSQQRGAKIWNSLRNYAESAAWSSQQQNSISSKLVQMDIIPTAKNAKTLIREDTGKLTAA
jgi:hypothetical protein